MLISVKQKRSQNSPALRIVTNFTRKINSEPQYCSWDFKLQCMTVWSEIPDFTASNALLLWVVCENKIYNIQHLTCHT